MMRRLATIAAVAALGGAQAAAAAAPQTCLSEREVANLAIYAAPSLILGVRGKCAPSLAADGFLATHGDAFASRYIQLQKETWPGAKSALAKLASAKRGASDDFALLADLPDEAVRPLFDALIAQKVGEEINPADCRKVERGIQLLSPLAPRDSGALVGFIFALAKPGDIAICPPKP